MYTRVVKRRSRSGKSFNIVKAFTKLVERVGNFIDFLCIRVALLPKGLQKIDYKVFVVIF